MTHRSETQNPTLKAVKCLKEIGFDLTRIRKALPALTGITHPRTAEILGGSRQSVASTMNAARENLGMQARLAGVYGVPVHEIIDVKCLSAACRAESGKTGYRHAADSAIGDLLFRHG
ncbi:hypothetical protein [Desulfatitalea alkaliphila]|uniref:Uncharacterized protein n=1 Tax=Desulfatitalea alkaliphila TaxID=2929485 RepID=A0AA41R3U4_9BACT|nr:hypothetical protein [Desulfatitalea alkaliphila]MCJ8502579.1 hypothetical protein [Desulfatitalea alkaliphila]